LPVWRAALLLVTMVRVKAAQASACRLPEPAQVSVLLE
jgi:hypothetical protein